MPHGTAKGHKSIAPTRVFNIYITLPQSTKDNGLRQSVTRDARSPDSLVTADLPPGMESPPRFWYDRLQERHTREGPDTRRGGCDLQRGPRTGHRLAPAGQAPLVSRPQASIRARRRLPRRSDNGTHR